MDKITLKNMKFFGYHGCEEFERRKGQIFEADVELFLRADAAGLSDNLADAVDYVSVFEKVKAVMENERYNLLERLAQRLADRVLEDERIQATILRVRKPGVPLSGLLDCVELEIHRERQQ